MKLGFKGETLTREERLTTAVASAVVIVAVALIYFASSDFFHGEIKSPDRELRLILILMKTFAFEFVIGSLALGISAFIYACFQPRWMRRVLVAAFHHFWAIVAALFACVIGLNVFLYFASK